MRGVPETTDHREQKMEDRRFRDGLISLGWFVGVSIVDALTTNRILRFSGAVTLGIACYAMTSKPRLHFVLFLGGVLVVAACWVNDDRIDSLLRQMFARCCSW